MNQRKLQVAKQEMQSMSIDSLGVSELKWTGERSQDGRGIGRGDHFLFYKFIERTTER